MITTLIQTAAALFRANGRDDARVRRVRWRGRDGRWQWQAV